MKKLFLSLIFGILLVVGNVYAASVVLYGTTATEGDYALQVTAEVTAHTDGTVDDTQLKDSLGVVLQLRKGYRLHAVRTFFGSPAPTDNSDFTLNELANDVDVLGGAGANMIDNATNNTFKPVIGSTPVDAPVYGPLTLKISGNSVNGAKFRIVFDFIPM